MDKSKRILQLLSNLQIILQETLVLIGQSLLVEADKRISDAKDDDEILEIIQDVNKRMFDLIRDHTTALQKEHDEFMNDPEAMKEAAVSLSEKMGWNVVEVLDNLGLEHTEEETKLLEWKNNDDDDTTKH